MSTKCACGNPNCPIEIRVEDTKHLMLIGKDGCASLMYLDEDTRRELIRQLEDAPSLED